jgi:hypothetical protein
MKKRIPSNVQSLKKRKSGVPAKPKKPKNKQTRRKNDAKNA